jgi:hypothetical protein
MAVRSFVTAGVSFAAAAAVATTVALAPPMSPRDIQVAKNTEVSLNALVTDPYFAGLIDLFFASGASGVVQALLTQNADAPTAAQINAFFNGGISQLVELRLLASTTDENQIAYIHKFFDEAPTDDPGTPNFSQFGFSGVFYKFLTDTGLSDEQQRALNIFFNLGTCDANGENCVGSSNAALFGFSGLIREALLNSTTDTGQEQLITDFFDGGATLVVQNALLNSTADPGQKQLINDFFTGGVSQVVNTALVNSTSDPQQKADINTFFNAAGNDNPSQFGVSGVVYQHLLGATQPGTAQQDLVNQFFTNGISGVVNYILTGATIPTTTLLKTAAPEEETVAPLSLARAAAPAVDPVDKTPVDKTLVVKKSDPVTAAPAVVTAAVAADPAPAVVKTKDKADGADDVTDAMKDGNKVEVDPIIIPVGGKGAAKPGEGGFGIFGEIAGAIGRFITGTPAPASTTTGTETGGTS